MSDLTSTRIANVRTIGKGERLTADVAAEIVAAMPETYDWTKRGAVPAAIHAYSTDNGAVETPKQMSGPEGQQVPTDYGRGVDRLRKAVAALLKESDDTPKEPVLRATLSGEGGGTVTVEMDSDLGRALIALIKGTETEQADAA